MHYCSDNNATREYRRISTRDYDVAKTEPGMPRNIIDESLIDSTSIPMKIAEISFSTYGTTYIGMRIEHRNNNRIMFRYEIDNTHDAETARHAHIFSHTVGITFVYGYEVIELIDRIAHHFRRYGHKSTHRLHLKTLQISGVLVHSNLFVGHGSQLSFKIQIALCEFLVHFGQ